MKQFYFECQPWHLEREGADEALARMAGEIGVDGVQLCVSGSGSAALYPRGPQGPRIDSCDAGLQFQLDPSKYSSVRVRPRIASWMKSRNPLEAVCKLAERHRLKVRVALPRSIDMPERSTYATIINALGDVSPWAHCFAHPDTHELLAALVEDLSTHYPIEVVELEAPRRPIAQAAFYVTWFPVSTLHGGPFNECLAWCFCPACRQQAQAAGVDAGQVQTTIVALVTALLAGKTPAREWNEFVAEDAVLAGYASWQEAARGLLVRQLRERCKKSLSVRPHDSGDAVDTAKPELRKWGDACDRLSFRAVNGVCPDDPEDVRRLGSEIAAARSESPPLPADMKVDLLLPCRPPEVRDGPHLVSLTHEAAQTGCEAIIFQDYATSPDVCLDWVRQAIRYARRESK
ncbi:hypothetical protein RAS2_08830 [Phycisphaerae bacterium RAS2]|nr:hypothetical protein RAS2_08830 [Phycisphaerae bacterium RAS2]